MKTVKEVIADLQKLDPDLPVYVFADHGQTLIQGGDVSVTAIQELSYWGEQFYNEEDGDEPSMDGVKICVIGD